jgi:hypothetical protein
MRNGPLSVLRGPPKKVVGPAKTCLIPNEVLALRPHVLPIAKARWQARGERHHGSVVSSLHCMDDPQPEGHMASYIERENS